MVAEEVERGGEVSLSCYFLSYVSIFRLLCDPIEIVRLKLGFLYSVQ